MNLIPPAPADAPHYWCTWMAQTSDFVKPGELGGTDRIDEKLMFGDAGWLTRFLPEARRDLMVLVDAGWDVPQGYDANTIQPFYGLLAPHPQRFPSLKGSQADQLAQLNRKIQGLGWRSTGIWIIAQGYGEAYGQPLLPDTQVEADYRKKAQWSREAGIAYWKVDFGMRGESYLFRRMLTRVVREEVPGLQIEHVRNQGPFNGNPEQPGEDPRLVVGRWRDSYFQIYRGGTLFEFCMAMLPNCDALRTYDVSWPLSTAITLDRVATLLEAASLDKACTAHLNCEDEPYMAAGLSIVMGILRYPEAKPEKPRGIDPHGVNQRMDEVVRAVRWSRIAPPLRASEVVTTCDANILADAWTYQQGDVWVDWVMGKVVRQGAPARVARNMPLPEVRCEGEAPFVLCTRHPNGSTGVATLPRVVTGRTRSIPRADITLEVDNAHGRIGVFGHYRSLTLRFPALPPMFRVWAQDLKGDTAKEVTGEVERVDANRLRLPGAWIDQMGLSAATRGDESDPGLVLCVEAKA